MQKKLTMGTDSLSTNKGLLFLTAIGSPSVFLHEPGPSHSVSISLTHVFLSVQSYSQVYLQKQRR